MLFGSHVDPMNKMPTIKFTDKKIKSLKTSKQREDFWDESLKGFLTRVYSSGRKNYELVYRTSTNRRGRFKIGDANLISLYDARKKAKELLVEVSNGNDPSNRRRDLRTASNFKELCTKFIDIHCKPNLRPKSISDITYIVNTYLLTSWSSRKITDISRADILELIERIGIKNQSPVMANHVRSTLTSIFNFAIQRELIETSPCVGLPKKYKERLRTHVLNDQDILDLWRATEDEDPVIRDLFRVLLLLGQRSGETKKMRWSQIKGNIWTIPASETKNKQDHHIPLPSIVLEILNQHKTDSDFIFSSYTGENIKWLQKANYRILDKIQSYYSDTDQKPQRWRIHDLRRTFATGLEKLGIGDSTISALLNHNKISRLGVTGRYARHTYIKEKEIALAKWSEFVILNTVENKLKKVA